MAFQLSPGVNVSEIDLTTIIPSLSTSSAAFAGNFDWGPLDKVITVSNELKLVEYFGKPTANTYEGWFSAANFLAYSNNLKVVRVANTAHKNATTNATPILIKNEDDYNQYYSNNSSTLEVYGDFAAKYAGSLGNSLGISICPNANAWSMNVASATSNGMVTAATSAGNTSITAKGIVDNYIKIGDLIALKDATTTTDYVAVTNITGNVITVAEGFSASVLANSSIQRRWKYYNDFSDQPETTPFTEARSGANDEMHIVVYDRLGQITGYKETIIEKFGFVSKASDAKNPDGSTNYYKDVINARSRYLWHLVHPSIAGVIVTGTNSIQ